jgi:hypothetical protein
MVPSDAATESLFVAKGNPQNEIASFQAHQPQKLAISNQLANQKSTRAQPFRHSSRPTNQFVERRAEELPDLFEDAA